MTEITLQSSRKVVPMIYAYSTPEIKRHDGWIKIGYTEQPVEKRIKQQTHTADVQVHLEWKGNAVYDDGSGERFTDSDFHAYLRKRGFKQSTEKRNEWFEITGDISHKEFHIFRMHHGVLDATDILPYTLREEQEVAVERAKSYFLSHEKGEFLYNAKPRFGKTLTVYDLCKRLDAQNVLVVTNRPAIANSWYDDYVKFLGEPSGYQFVSTTDALKGKPYVLDREQYTRGLLQREHKCIEFVSLQDLKGSQYFGGQYKKLKEVAELLWDLLVIDEAHEGVDTIKTDVAFDHIQRKYTLHLSGTPFKALANDKFSQEAIYNWTYADEQRAKREWKGDGENPYGTLPQLHLYTYRMSDIIREELEQGIMIDGKTEEYAFDLNEFFATKSGRFVHDASVDRFLDALTTQHKFPFSTDDLRQELKHTFWMLDRVDSARALAKKLEKHPIFSAYKIILAAGDGKLDDDEETKKSLDKVREAITKYDKTITLSVGQLTTGVTVPEWTGVLMLRNMKSPALYMQTAFRAQNPCLFSENGSFYRKENAYVFDFDPARTLMIFEEFANDLSSETSDGRGSADRRKENVRELLNFFPVIGEDDRGEMMELDAEQVLSVPRKIRSQEVVRRGFMSDFLFQNISHVFHAPQEVQHILNRFEAVQKPKSSVNIPRDAVNALSLNEKGDVELGADLVAEEAKRLLGDKIYHDKDQLEDAIRTVEKEKTDESDKLKYLKNIFVKTTTEPILAEAKEKYAADLKPSEQKRLERDLRNESDRIVQKLYENHCIDLNLLEQERQERLQACTTADQKKKIEREYTEKKQKAEETLQSSFREKAGELIQTATEKTVTAVETSKREEAKKSIEDGIRDHLRGFSRTIPSFLMAYGDETVTLDTFDHIIPAEVFQEVTSVTLEEFRFLRDGGSYKDEETGEEKYFKGQLFDPVVFNDSVKEFLRLKRKLANYFDETATEDIFDYIPPQKTNQIFTPKKVVKMMGDMLEKENPGCFDDPNKTFIDLYMKSGLYITEIIKRLYRSRKMKKLYPDREMRLQHIFEKQVYGLAPTDIIYRIATNYILGFDKNIQVTTSHFVKEDALPYAKAGELQGRLETLFGEDVS